LKNEADEIAEAEAERKRIMEEKLEQERKE
jgi:hypothetical protein